MDLFETYELLKIDKSLKDKYDYYCKIETCAKKFIGERVLLWMRRATIILPIFLLIGLIIYYFIDWKHSFKSITFTDIFTLINVIFTPILISICLLLSLGICYFLLWSTLKIIHKLRKLTKKEAFILNDAKKKIAELRSKHFNIKDELINSEVPEYYRNLKAVGWMITAYNNGRASNLTDLINLFECELKEENYNNVISDLKEQCRKQQISLEQANQTIEVLRKDTREAKKAAESAKRDAKHAQFISHIK